MKPQLTFMRNRCRSDEICALLITSAMLLELEDGGGEEIREGSETKELVKEE